MVRIEDGLQVTSAADFRTQGELLRLPSERVVKVREADLLNMVLVSDDVPDFITGAVLAGLNNQHQSLGFEVDKDNLGDFFGFVNTVVRATVIEPRVTEQPNYDAGEISVDDLTTQDKLWIWEAVMPSQEMSVAQSFRQRVENANMALVRDVPDDGDTSERDRGPEE